MFTEDVEPTVTFGHVREIQTRMHDGVRFLRRNRPRQLRAFERATATHDMFTQLLLCRYPFSRAMTCVATAAQVDLDAPVNRSVVLRTGNARRLNDAILSITTSLASYS